MHYAQIQNGKVTAISEGPSEMVRIESANAALLGTTYTGPTQPFATVADFTGFKASLTANKTSMAADGVETVTFNIVIKTWEGSVASSFNGTIKINVNGSRKDLTVTNGAASYVYKTTAIGVKTITTQDADGYPYIAHGSVTVEAFGDLEEL